MRRDLREAFDARHQPKPKNVGSKEMSAMVRTTDLTRTSRHVRVVPKAEVTALAKCTAGQKRGNNFCGCAFATITAALTEVLKRA